MLCELYSGWIRLIEQLLRYISVDELVLFDYSLNLFSVI